MSTDYNTVEWTADDLLAEVFTACRFPANGTVDYTPTVVFRRCTDAIWNWATHQIATARDGRMASFLTRDIATQAINATGNEFELPPMAVADSIDSVSWESADGGGPHRLQLIPLGQEALYRDGDGADVPSCYLLLDGRVRVIPTPSSGGRIVITYQRRHGELVSKNASSTSNVTAVSGPPGPPVISFSGGLAPAPGTWVDIISQFYPYRIKLHGGRVTAATASTVTLGGESAADVQKMGIVGDKIAIYGKTCFVHLPLEMRLSLTKRVAVDIVREIGDMALAEQLSTFAEEEAARTRDMLSPRVKSDREKVISRNSLARRGVRGRFGGWGS